MQLFETFVQNWQSCKLHTSVEQVKMKRFKLILSIVACLVSSSVQAQTVGTIGVGDIRFSASGDQPRSKDKVISAISSGLNSALKDTRKFSVLDYAQLSKRIAKQGLNLEDYYNKTYSGTEYVQAGLDYILTANVTAFGLSEEDRGKSKDVVGLIDIEYKLIGVADSTSDIVSKVSVQSKQTISVDPKGVSNEVSDEVIKQTVDQLVDQIIAALFPIRVMQIAENGEILLNYGAGLLSPGDTVLVYALGADIIAGTGQGMGQSVATLKITSTEKKFSSAQASSGFANVVKGQQGHLLLSGG
jgi:hypothetical protein